MRSKTYCFQVLIVAGLTFSKETMAHIRLKTAAIGGIRTVQSTVCIANATTEDQFSSVYHSGIEFMNGIDTIPKPQSSPVKEVPKSKKQIKPEPVNVTVKPSVTPIITPVVKPVIKPVIVKPKAIIKPAIKLR